MIILNVSANTDIMIRQMFNVNAVTKNAGLVKLNKIIIVYHVMQKHLYFKMENVCQVVPNMPFKTMMAFVKNAILVVKDVFFIARLVLLNVFFLNIY